VRVTGLDEIYDPWASSEQDSARRSAVLEALLNATEPEAYAALWAEPATSGHPLRRRIEVPEADVALEVVLPHPFRGIHLVDIVPLAPNG
jgi:hypothetical protein